MSSRRKKGSLGKDLDLLLGVGRKKRETPEASADEPSQAPAESTADNGLKHLPLEQLTRGKYQPRREFEETALEELASSIREQGVLQPIVVRPIASGYEIIAGERRWRASQRAGLDRIPALVRDISDDAAIAMALIENIQRENLNPVEEAIALKRLQTEFSLSQQQVAERVGKSRSAIANLLRLLTLESEVTAMLETGSLETGHAKVLLGLEGPLQINAARQVVNEGLSVRQTEALVKKILKRDADPIPSTPKVDPDIARLEQDLSGRLGAAVAIDHSGSGRGKLTIKYTNLDELDGILKRIR